MGMAEKPDILVTGSYVTGDPGKAAVDNFVRWLRGDNPHSVVDPSERI